MVQWNGLEREASQDQALRIQMTERPETEPEVIGGWTDRWRS